MVIFNRRIAMKTTFFTHCSAALALGVAIAFASCNKIESELPVDDGTLTIEFQQVDPDALADGATRTEFHDNTIWWSEGDKVVFMQYASVDGQMTYKSSSVEISSASKKISASISRFNVPDEGTDSYYCSVYPSASFTNYNTSLGHLLARINTPDTQAPSATGYDPAADLLISNYAENLTPGSDGKYTVQLSYYRQVALGKMHLKNLPSESQIASVEFSAVHNGSDVTLAGAKWYDFTTQAPYSVYSRKNKLTLDYSEQEISGDMTAYFCCYPFELGTDDFFTVKVVTKAGEVFTRKVTLPDSRTLSFEADRGTQFTVDMSTAKKMDSWFTVDEHSSSTQNKTTNKIYFRVHTEAKNVVSGKFMAVSEAAFEDITDIGEYLDANGTSLSDNSISSINSNGHSVSLTKSSLKGDSWYVAMAKLVLEDGTVGVAFTHIKTDWFTLTAETRAEGGIIYRFYGANISSKTRNSRIIATDALPEGTTFEDYYTNTLAPGGIPGETRTAINEKAGASSAGYQTTKYYTGKSTTATMTPGTNYTVMIKVYNERGETKFVTASADAGGSTE